MNSASSSSSTGSTWRRRLGRLAVIAIALIALFALLGFFAVPPLVKSKVETLVSEATGRKAALAKVEFNPFTLRARLLDFTLADRNGGRTLFAFEALDVDLSSASLWYRAPVVDAVRLVRPRLEIVRDAQGAYNLQDLVDKAAAPSDKPTSHFAINNIEIDDGSVLLDDAMHRRKVTLSRLDVGIPFLSSFAQDARIRVTPRLAGAIDGAAFALTGTSTSPFEATQEATLALNVDALALPLYVSYAPLPNSLKLADGALTTRLTLAFVTEKGSPRGISLTGAARVDRLALERSDGSSLISAKSIETSLAKLDLLARSLAFDRVTVDGPVVDVRRLAGGAMELSSLLAPTAPVEAPARADSDEKGVARRGSSAQSAPWAWSIANARVGGGTVRFADRAVTPAFAMQLSNLAATASKIASTGTPGVIEAAFDLDDEGHFSTRTEIDVAANSARGHFDLKKLALARLHPYYGDAIEATVRRGTLDFGGDFEAASAGASPRIRLARGSAALADLDVLLHGEREPLGRIARLDVQGIAFDLADRSVSIDSVAGGDGALHIVRDGDGNIQFGRAASFPTAVNAAASRPRTRVVTKPADDRDWRVLVRRIEVERFGADFEDRSSQPPVKLRVADARIAATNLSSEPGAKMSVDVAARIGAQGRMHVVGTVGAQPVLAECRIDARAIDLVPFRPYFEALTNVVVTSGAVTAKGRMSYASGTDGPRGRYTGDVSVSGFGSLDRPASQELVRWKTLSLTGLDVASQPFDLAVGALALDGFYARLILNADATLNLQQLVARSDASQAAPVPEAASSVATASPVAEKQSASTQAGAPRSASAATIAASIGRIELSNGEVEYSDFFVKPNYSAHLEGVKGSVSSMSPTQAGAIELTATVEGTAPVDIRGSVNPFARELSLDLGAKASDIELPPLTPYAVKYAGYGIQKGKLSMEVRYQLENRKLAASNKLKLDQLTFGERVESPTATKLPVLLAVSLLKDRNGVINLDLPIEGTLDDPQFSVWGLVVQVVVNLIGKAVTAPFALLGSLVGGSGGDQLAYVEFAPGHADLTPAAQAKLSSLAKALTDRPALKLDAAGRAIPAVDRDALKHAALDRELRVHKQKELARAGSSAPAVEDIKIATEEYPDLLEAVYRETDLRDKPRNAIGMTKKIPPAEMEAMLLASYQVNDDALRALARKRAETVKEWLAQKGNVAVDRLFTVSPLLNADGVKPGDGAATRVDFAIR